MLKKLMLQLGYVPKKDYEKLETTLRESNNTSEKLINSLHTKRDKIDSLNIQLKHSIELNEEQVVKINSLKTDNNNLYEENKRLKKLFKETKRKESVLLKKQGKFKEEINYLNQKVKLLEHYNYAVITKLEELCFGSVLPRLMKQLDLSKYMYPLKPLKIMWSTENGNIRIEAVGVEEINEKVQ